MAFSSFTVTFSQVSPFAKGDLDKIVNNENELKNSINNAASKGITIALNNDITLTDTLTIPSSKNITLTSNKSSGCYKLVGVADKSTITVEDSGILRLNGIIVTHASGTMGRGVMVIFGGTLVMSSGEIFGNVIVNDNGGGVRNFGTFNLVSGVICGNTADNGGGVYNTGDFVMSGGEISENTATDCGGGVYNILGSLSMSGGKISGNTASRGGGVYKNGWGAYQVMSGEISGNTANIGKDVYPDDSGELSSDNDKTPEGNNGFSDNNGATTITNEQNKDILSLKVVIICASIVVIGIIASCLLFLPRKNESVEENEPPVE